MQGAWCPTTRKLGSIWEERGRREPGEPPIRDHSGRNNLDWTHHPGKSLKITTRHDTTGQDRTGHKAEKKSVQFQRGDEPGVHVAHSILRLLFFTDDFSGCPQLPPPPATNHQRRDTNSASKTTLLGAPEAVRRESSTRPWPEAHDTPRDLNGMPFLPIVKGPGARLANTDEGEHLPASARHVR